MKALHLVVVAVLLLPAVGAGPAPGGDASVPASQPSGGTVAPAARSTGAESVPSPTRRRSVADAPAGIDRVEQVDHTPRPPGTVNALGVRSNVSNRSGFGTAYVDLGPALGVESAAASHRLRTIRAVRRVQSADGHAERTRRLRTELRTIERRTDALGGTQRDVLSAYVADRLTAEELLVDLAELDHEARSLDDRRRRLWTIANRTGASVDDDRFRALGRELDAYDGPVRAQVTAVLTGEADAGRFYVSTTPRGVVIATLTDDAYLREAYRGDLRRVGNGPINGSTAADVVAGDYPGVWQARQEVDAEGGRIARVRVEYLGGRLTTLIGSGNRRVFVDEHRRSLALAGSNTTAVNTRDGLRMTINRSYAGGPMRLELRDTDGNRVNASVTVGPAGGRSVTVGHTGSDGRLWMLTPHQRFTIVAIHGQSVVFLTMDPLSTPDPGTKATGGS
ncbi:MAG: hypothetical protein ABEJ81_02360 [Haloferacaceae archaeon]